MYRAMLRPHARRNPRRPIARCRCQAPARRRFPHPPFHLAVAVVRNGLEATLPPHTMHGLTWIKRASFSERTMTGDHCRQDRLPRQDLLADGDVHMHEGEASKQPHPEVMQRMHFLTSAEERNNPSEQSVVPAIDTLAFAVERVPGECHEERRNRE